MSARLKCPSGGVAPSTRRVVVRKASGSSGHGGVGMLEFLLALLIFSMGMMGLLSAQLAGKRADYDASQRSVATALARDILERIRANPGQAAAYRVSAGGDMRQRLPYPGLDCESSACSAAQLAAFDLWQWEALLLGAAETDSAGSAGGLAAPQACITTEGGRVAVVINWLGASTSRRPPVLLCSGLDAPGDPAPETAADPARRHELSFATFIGPR